MNAKSSRMSGLQSTSAASQSASDAQSNPPAMQTSVVPNARYTSQKLKYDIYAWSSHAVSYVPKHILVNKPNDQSSRWLSASNDKSQFVTVKLDSMSVVQHITFGKYHKVHVSNLKEFKVFGGVNPDDMMEILHAGLRNDSEKETFALKYKFNNVV